MNDELENELAKWDTSNWNGKKVEPPPIIYRNFVKTITTRPDPHVLVIPLKRINNALQGDKCWACSVEDRNSETFKSHRYERILEQIDAGLEMHMPWLYFTYGRTRIMDGRHRLYAFIDRGFTHTSVVVDPPYLAAIKTLTDP